MAIDLVSLIKQFLTPDMVQKLAATLGLDATQVQTAIGGAVPALLAGMAGTAKQPGGAQRLAEAANQQASALDGFAGMLSASSQTGLVETGSKLVGSLLGSNTQTALSSAISTFSGIGQSGVTALLGALAPVVLGLIGKQAGPQGFNAESLGALLNGQKNNIAGALPPRLGGLLEGSGVLDGLEEVSNSAKAVGASAKQYAGASAAAAANAAQATASTGRSWAMWAIPLALVVLGLWYFVGRQSPDTLPAQQFTNKAVAPVTTTPPPLLIGNVDVAQTLTDSLGTLKTSLEGVNDAASAQTALPQLQNVNAEIDKVGAVIGNATAEQKAAVKGLVEPIVAQINPVIDRVLAIPGIDALKPTIDGIRSKLTSLAS